MGGEFPDRSSILFGRNPDLYHLLGRAENTGITAIAGRAQMGKSWLLTELARRLSAPPSQYVLGFTESLGETPDLLLRAVADLYTRWLSDSNYWEQARVVWQQQKKDLVSNVGKAFGSIVKEISKIGEKTVEAVGGLVKETFEGLASANRELLSGGIQLPRLQIEQGRDLLALVFRITGRPLVLVLDQWEKSPAIELETNILDAFVRHLDEWPPCHIFVGVRSDENPSAAVKGLRDGFPGAVEVYDLPPMHLEGSASGDLIQHVRERVPAAVTVADHKLLEMISGYPGTVARWTSSYYAHTVKADGLKGLADDANAYRFAEFKVVVPDLSDDERCLAMRLALLPSAGGEGGWQALRDVVLQGLQARCLDGLKRKKLLEAGAPPSYGHAKRSEAALQCFTDDYREELREESEALVIRLGSRVGNIAPETLPFADALIALLPVATDLDLPSLFQAICRSALSLTGIQTLAPEMMRSTVETDGVRLAAVAPLMAMGLFNAVVHAKQEEALERRDALLVQLRQLARNYPDDAAVRERLAKGLVNTVVHAKQEEAFERRDALLDELRQLARSYPSDAAVRELLAKGLFNALVDAKQEAALERRDALLEELRKLARNYPGDAALRALLATGLVNTLVHAKQEKAFERRDGLLEELRQLARNYLDDAALRERLATGLFNAVADPEQEEALERRDALLEELRQLARKYPDDAVVRERLATGLFNALFHAKQEEALDRRDGLLAELRQLAQSYPDDAAVRKQLANGLFNTLVHAKQEEALERRDGLLAELRHLARNYPDDAAVRELLAKGLFKTLIDAKREEAVERCGALLEELRQLARTYPQDAFLREIAQSLVNGS